MSLSVLRRFWRSSPHANRLLLGGCVLVALGLASGGLAAWKLWKDAAAGAEAQAHNLGVVLAEQTVRSLQAVSLVLQDIDGELLSDGMEDHAAFTARIESRDFFEALTARLKDLPQASALAVVDINGKLVNYTRSFPAPVLDLKDRDYVRQCSQNDPAPEYVSEFTASRAIDIPVFYLARCLSAANGTRLGVLISAIKIPYFMNFYATIGLPPGTSMAIRRLGGDALVRFPREGPDAPPRAGPANEGTHFVASVPLSSYPLTMEVGLARSTAFAQWRGQVKWIIAGLVCATLGLLLTMRRLVAIISRFQRVQGVLEERNSALTAAKLNLKSQTLALLRKTDALRESEARLAKQSRVLETTLEHINQGLIMIDANREVAVCNRRAMEMMDLPEALMLSHPRFSDVLAYQWRQNEFDATPASLNELVRQGGILDKAHTYERQRPNGMIIEVCSVPMEGGGLVRTYSDITTRKQAEQRLTYLAYHDELTGLANRNMLHDTLRRMIGEGGEGLALLYLDLDRFTLVNDTRGHEVGDRLLREVSARMTANLPEGAVTARIGGDEFAVILPGAARAEVAVPLAEALKGKLSDPYQIDAELCRVGVSIGIAFHPADGATAETLYRSADSALHRAKAIGRNAICCHESAVEQDVRGRLILEQDLRLALQGEQFEIAYQPIFDMQAGLPFCMEALVRWRHPTRGLLSPDQFIPLAEETGLINELGRWVLRTACKEAATWALPVRLAVNLSSVQFGQADLETQVTTALEESGLAAERLDLEVTESLLISDTFQVRDAMLALRRRGIRLVMDDFGTGHSSLKALQGFPFQQIKIDRSFVAGVHDEAGSGAIIRAMLSMAASMKLEVVAEGVETAAQVDLLRSLGCNYLQGFLLERPRTAQWTRDFLWRCTTQRSGDLMGDRALAL